MTREEVINVLKECVNYLETEGWKYPSKGELPEKREMNVSDHCIVAEVGCAYARAGYYDFDQQKWFVDGFNQPVDVYAWKSGKPPKEVK